tara:strand:+ start:1014 stop:1682 length:669 start_codon:yes stop_codon:yes gene_type:complete
MSVDYINGMPYGASDRNPFNYVKFEQVARDSTTAWLTLEECTQQLNLIDDESQDAFVSNIELATRFAIEDYLGMSIFPTTYRVYYGAESIYVNPCSFDLPEVSQNANSANPDLTINSVKFYSNASPSVLTTLGVDNYYYDPSGNKVVASGFGGSVNTYMTAPIVIEYTTAANILASYPVIRQAGLLLLTHLYNNRSNSVDTPIRDIPFGVNMLLRSYKPLVM